MIRGKGPEWMSEQCSTPQARSPYDINNCAALAFRHKCAPNPNARHETTVVGPNRDDKTIRPPLYTLAPHHTHRQDHEPRYASVGVTSVEEAGLGALPPHGTEML